MLNHCQRALLNSEAPNSLGATTEYHLNTNDIVLVISDEEIVSEFCVLTSIGIGWVRKENLVET
jgi:hypothetical protein